MDPRKILKVINSREEDSKRLDAILESMSSRDDLMDRTILYFPNGYSMSYDAEFKVFEAFGNGSNLNNFKDGREAIDYCLDPEPEIEEEIEKDSDVGELPPASERGIESANSDNAVKPETTENQQKKES